MDCPEETLQDFVAVWRRELATAGRSSRSLGKREDREEQDGEEFPQLWSEKKPRREPSPLLILPPVCKAEVVNVPLPEKTENTPSFVETLIADLDDINTVPFFEVKLPREVALLIFQYLSMSDLCTCAQVSRSWHTLANDNVLWSGICQTMGYDISVKDAGDILWKTVVKDIVLREKKELRNWRERVCGLSDFQPDRNGVLTCADFCSDELQLLAGYSCGAVHVWHLNSEEAQLTLEPANKQLTIPTACCISKGWAAVVTEIGVLTVYDSCVGGMLHRVGGLGHVVCLDLKWNETSLVVAVATSIPHQEQIVQNGPVLKSEITVFTYQDGCDWGAQVLSPFQDSIPATINHLSVLESCQRLLFSTQTTLSIHSIRSSGSLPYSHPPCHSILTSAGSSGNTVINCFDHTSSTVACGTSAWGYHVQLYDLATGSHIINLRGHAQPVSSVNIHNSPHNTLVTGSSDRRVRVFDTRSSQPSLTLTGHHGTITSTQCDDWKVTSAGKDGLVVVWDRRMCGELWNSHDRHPVSGCWFTSRYLVAAHIPERSQRQDLSKVLHRCQRGLLRVMDFSVDPLYYTRILPSICSSGYDEPTRSLYHLDLKLPYDTIVT